MSETAAPSRTDIPPAALWLGYAGLIPFVAGAMAVWSGSGEWAAFALRAQILYGVVILSFMGAVHWGLAIAEYGSDDGSEPAWGRLGVSVTPALLAWFATFLVAWAALLVLIVCFVGLFFFDVRETRAGRAPAWYPRLRRPLTIIVVLSLAASLARFVTIH